MAKLGDLVVNIGANTKDLNRKLGRVRRDMRSMTSNFTAVGQNMTRSLTMPLALVGGAAVKLAVDFESAMAQVKATSGATAGDFKRLEQSAKDLGASTIFTAREVAGLQLEYSRLGFSANEIIQVQEATLNLAQATGSDLAQAADVAGSTLRAFGLDASETTRVTDVMAASFNAVPLQIDNFQESMKHVAPMAKAAGVSLEETTAMLGVLAKSGIRGSQAGTALRRILQEMQGTSGTLTERFAELAAKGIGVQGAMDEVGRRAGTSLLVLTEGVGQVNELTTAFEDSAGSAKDMADVMNDTAKGSLKAMTSALEGAGIALGEILIPFVTDAANFIRELATKFKELSEDTQQNIVKAAAFVAALGPMLIIIPKIVHAINLMRIATIATSGAMATLGNVMAVTFGAKALLGPGKYVAGLRAIVKVKKLLIAGLQRIPLLAAGAFAFAGIKHAIDEINTATEAVRRYTQHRRIMLNLEKQTAKFLEDENTRLANQTKALNGTSESVQDYTNTLEVLTIENARFWEAYESGEAALAQTEGSVKLSKEAYDILKETMEEMIPMASDMLPVALQEVRNKLEAKRQALIDAANAQTDYNEAVEESVEILQDVPLPALMMAQSFQEVTNGIQDFVLESTPQLLGFLNDFETVAEGVSDAAVDMADSVTGITSDLDSFAQAVEATMEQAATAMLTNISAMAGGAEMGIEGILTPLANMAISLGELAIGYGITITGIKKALESLSGPAAIAAGIALVALGTGLKGAIAKRAEENLPELASGGIAYGPTTALVGDNKNARIDPEVIAPLSKIRDMLGGGSTNVYGRISGDDIVISNDRATRDRNRFA